MAFSLRVLMISALIIGLCSSDDIVPEKTGVVQQSAESQNSNVTPTSPLGSVTSDTVEPTSPPGSVTSDTVDPTSPPGSVTSGPVNPTSLPVNPTSLPGSVTSGPVKPTSPSVSVTTPSIPPRTCHNGGTFDGTICICALGFSGDACETAVPVIPDAFNRTVNINVVFRKEYLEAFDDSSSNEYKEFVKFFLDEMRPVYKNVPHFKDVIVTRLSREDPDSTFDLAAEEIREVKAEAFHLKDSTSNVNVAHEVVLEVENGNHETQYDEGYKEIEKTLRNLNDSNVTNFRTAKEEVDKDGFCRKAMPDSDVATYFSVYELENRTIVCRSRCDKEHDEPITCNNGGTCNIYIVLGEICRCENVNNTWYLGERCDLPIQKVAFYAGLSVTLAVLLVAVATLVAYAVVNKRKHTKKKDIKQKLVNQWLDDDFEWSRAASSLDKQGAKNRSVMYGNQQMPFTSGSNRSNPSQRKFSLPQNLHRYDLSFPNPGYDKAPMSPSPYMDSRFNLPMRPEIRGSWDV